MSKEYVFFFFNLTLRDSSFNFLSWPDVTTIIGLTAWEAKEHS